MLDIKFVRENPELVKENIKKKFQDHKLPLVDEVIELDARNRAAVSEASALRAERNKLSKTIGALMGQGKKEEAEQVKAQVAAQAQRLKELEEEEDKLAARVREIMAAGKLVQCVPKADVQRLTENTVTAVQEAEYLRVCS